MIYKTLNFIKASDIPKHTRKSRTDLGPISEMLKQLKPGQALPIEATGGKKWSGYQLITLCRKSFSEKFEFLRSGDTVYAVLADTKK